MNMNKIIIFIVILLLGLSSLIIFYREDITAKFSLLTNYTFADNTSLFLNTSAKKTNSKQETYALNLGFKSIF